MVESSNKEGKRSISVETAEDIPLKIGTINLNAGHTTEITRHYPDIQKSNFFTEYKVKSNDSLHSSLDVSEFVSSPEAKNQNNVDLVIQLTDGELSNNQSSVFADSELYGRVKNDARMEYWQRMSSVALKIFHDSSTAKQLPDDIENKNLPHNPNSLNLEHVRETINMIPEISENDSENKIEDNITKWLQGEIEKRKY
jgi:hypothetical protein